MSTLFGFIGTGNMGSALATAACCSVPTNQVVLSNRTPAKAESLAQALNCQVGTNESIAETASYIFLGVKPQMMADLLSSIAPILAARKDRFVLVSMAAGLTIDTIRHMAGGEYPVIRIMPNTPASIGEGMILYTLGPSVTAAEKTTFLYLMSKAGKFAELPEHLIDAGAAVSGCGPAFADLFLESLADGGVACGLPRGTALTLAAQMLIGSAKLLLETEQHPGILKDAVCSPGGSTIQGVRILEQRGFRAAAMDAVIAACEKNKDLG